LAPFFSTTARFGWFDVLTSGALKTTPKVNFFFSVYPVIEFRSPDVPSQPTLSGLADLFFFSLF